MKRYRNIADLLVLKTRSFTPELVWGPGDHLYWGRSDDDVEMLQSYRGHHQETKQDVRRAVNRLLDIGRRYDADRDEALFRKDVAGFASRFGNLTGQLPSNINTNWLTRRFPDTLDEWSAEVLTFLDAYELRSALRNRVHIRGMTSRIMTSADGQSVFFITRAGMALPIAHGTRQITVKSAKDAEERVIEPATLARQGGKTLNWMIFGRLVESKLQGSIALAIDPTRPENIGLTPTGIVATLYARLLLDYLEIVDSSKLDRRCAYPGCENQLPTEARSDKLYCGAAHQKADRRRILQEMDSGGTHD